MIAHDDPTVGLDRTGNRGDHVPDRADFVVHRYRQSHLSRSRTDVVGERQTPLPARRHIGSRKTFQYLMSRVVGDWQARDRGEVVVSFQSFRLLQWPPSGKPLAASPLLAISLVMFSPSTFCEALRRF